MSAFSSQLSGADVYDFENRLILRTRSDGSTVNIVYDADGNRVAKNVLDPAGLPVTSTEWVVDTNNLTGYAQVVEERTSSLSPNASSLNVYTYGNQLISKSQVSGLSSLVTSYYAFDGHGNVRELTDSTGSVTDRYDYDAFGNLVFKSGSTPNNYVYCGEQFDPDLGLYSLRARFMNADSGRFWTMDTAAAQLDIPATLHHYTYASGNPAGRVDPTGLADLAEEVAGQTIDGDMDTALKKAEVQVGKSAVKKAACMVVKEAVNQVAIYVFFDVIQQKLYVGQSINLAARISAHLSDDRIVLNSAVWIFGSETAAKLNLRILEQQMIKALGGIDNLANMRNEIAAKYWSKFGCG